MFHAKGGQGLFTKFYVTVLFFCEDASKVMQNLGLSDAVADDAIKLNNTPNSPGPAVSVPPERTVVSPPGQFPRQHARRVVKSPPRMFKYQPLSPPISPGNPLSLNSPIQPPSPMSIPFSPGPRMEMFSRAPFGHQDVHVNMSSGSPPNYHTSPRTPVSPGFIAHPANHVPVNHQTMFRNAPGVPARTTFPLQQTRAIHGAQLFGSPNNPFQFGTFTGDYNVFVNSPPPPYRSPPGLLQRGPGCSPVARHDISNQGPRVFSCEDLERGGRLVEFPKGDQAVGFPRAPTSQAISLGTTETTLNCNSQPSVLEGLRLLNMNEANSSVQVTDQKETVFGRAIAPCIVSSGKVVQDFKPPARVEDVAVTTMVRI